MTPICIYCEAEFPQARADIGKTHCTDPACVRAWRRERSTNLRVALVPKSGFTIVTADDPTLGSGRSSGR